MQSKIKLVIEDKAEEFLNQLDKAMKNGLNKIKRDRVEKAKFLAPVKTGAYRKGITGNVLREGDRFVLVVGGKDQKSAWIEFGTQKMRPQRVIERAMEGVGPDIEKEISARADRIKVL